MILRLEATTMTERVGGTPCRLWKGETEAGVPVFVWIALVQPQTSDPAQLAAFETALREMPYRRELVSIDHRMVT